MEQSLSEKVNNIVNGKSRKAFEVFKELVSIPKKDSEAHFSIGYFYERGLGTEKDAMKALLHYRFSALTGFPFAIRNMQSMADSGYTEALPLLFDHYQRMMIPPDGKKAFSIFRQIAASRGILLSGALLNVAEKFFCGFEDEEIPELSSMLDQLSLEDIKAYNEVLSPGQVQLAMPVSLKEMRQESGLDSSFISGGWGLHDDHIVLSLPENSIGNESLLHSQNDIDDIIFDIMDALAFYHGVQAGLPEPGSEKISETVIKPEKSEKLFSGSINSNAAGKADIKKTVRYEYEISGLPAIILHSISRSAARKKNISPDKRALFEKAGQKLLVSFRIERFIDFA